MDLLVTTVDGETYRIPKTSMENFEKSSKESGYYGTISYADNTGKKNKIFLSKIIHVLETEEPSF